MGAAAAPGGLKSSYRAGHGCGEHQGEDTENRVSSPCQSMYAAFLAFPVRPLRHWTMYSASIGFQQVYTRVRPCWGAD